MFSGLPLIPCVLIHEYKEPGCNELVGHVGLATYRSKRKNPYSIKSLRDAWIFRWDHRDRQNYGIEVENNTSIQIKKMRNKILKQAS